MSALQNALQFIAAATGLMRQHYNLSYTNNIFLQIDDQKLGI